MLHSTYPHSQVLPHSHLWLIPYTLVCLRTHDYSYSHKLFEERAEAKRHFREVVLGTSRGEQDAKTTWMGMVEIDWVPEDRCRADGGSE